MRYDNDNALVMSQDLDRAAQRILAIGIQIGVWLVEHDQKGVAEHGARKTYALALPGALVGLGAAAFKPSSKTLCIATGVLALAAGLFTEWSTAPFLADGSLLYFLGHVHELRPMTMIMIAIGVVAGFAIPLRKP